jgi:hypothetical protein
LDDELADFSGTGPSVGVVAPGVGIYSTVPVGIGQREILASFVDSGSPLPVEVAVPEGSSGTTLGPTEITSCGFGSPTEIANCRPVGKVALISRGPGAPGRRRFRFTTSCVVLGKGERSVSFCTTIALAILSPLGRLLTTSPWAVVNR